MRIEIIMHTLGYIASALFFLVEIGLFLGFVVSLLIDRRAGNIDQARLRKLHQGTIVAMALALVYPVLVMLFTASLGIFDSFGLAFVVLAVSPVILERGLIARVR